MNKGHFLLKIFHVKKPPQDSKEIKLSLNTEKQRIESNETRGFCFLMPVASASCTHQLFIYLASLYFWNKGFFMVIEL